MIVGSTYDEDDTVYGEQNHKYRNMLAFDKVVERKIQPFSAIGMNKGTMQSSEHCLKAQEAS